MLSVMNALQTLREKKSKAYTDFSDFVSGSCFSQSLLDAGGKLSFEVGDAVGAEVLLASVGLSSVASALSTWLSRRN